MWNTAEIRHTKDMAAMQVNKIGSNAEIGTVTLIKTSFVFHQ